MVDLNPLHYINKVNHAFGDDLASKLEFLGISDPAVDPDGIREIAKKWRHLADGLDDARKDAELALKDVVWEGKTAKAFHRRARKARTQAQSMSHALRKGAHALDEFADKAHELLSEIGVLVMEIIEFEVAGLALSVLTAGLSEVASNLAAGERALKIVALVGRIEESGTAMAAVVRTVMETLRGLERAMKAMKEIKTIAAASKMAGEGMKFTAFITALDDPGAFKDPAKLTKLLAEGAIVGAGLGVLGKALGKGLKALKPSELAKLSKTLKLDGTGLSRLKLRPSEWEKLPASIRARFKKCELDPIDVATGDMLLQQTDLQLPGALPLVLERTHMSSYRWGGWFGSSWSSTLDQRLQADDEGITYTAPDGARLVYPHPAADAQEPVHPETGPRIPLTWDDEVDGALRVTDPDTGLAYVFHTPYATDDGEAVDLPLQHIVDRNGQRITVQYSQDGRPEEVSHSGGYRVALDHHPTLPRITGLRLLDPRNPEAAGTPVISYGYDDNGHLTDVINSSGLPLRFTYDDAGRITSWTDRNDTSYAYTYDERGRVVRTEGSGGFLNGTLAYDDETRTTTVTNSLGHANRYEHNEAHRLVRHTDPLGHVTTQEWDTEHRLTAITDPLGHTTRYGYDADGRVVSVVRPDGSETEAAYNELGLPVVLTAPDGSSWRQEFDARGNRTAVTDPAGATTRYGWNGAGHLTSATDPLGHTTTVASDSAGLPLAFTDPLSAVSRYERDSFGRPVAFTDAVGNVSRTAWTTEGKLAARTDPLGAEQSWEYDGEGNGTRHVDAIGGVTTFEHTYFDQLAAQTGPDGVRYAFEYDTEVRLVGVRNPAGLRWSYHYDPAGRLTSETDFDGRTISYEYDAAGRLVSRTDALGQVIRYEHDVLGRVVRKDADGQVTTYAYDAAGRLLEAAGADATVTYQRDVQGRITAEVCNGRALSSAYDALGRRTQRVTPTGAVSTWTYDAAGNCTALTTSGQTFAMEHDAAGRETARRFGQDLTLTQAWDPAGRLAVQTVTAPSTGMLQSRAYTYRPDSNLVGIEDQLTGPQRFDLDPAGRVTAVQARGWSERYAYDDSGNQTEAHWPADHAESEAQGTRTYTGTRITRAGNVRYEHDALGRTTLRQKTRLSRKPDTWRYTWDAEDRLTGVVTPDGTCWTYLYDPLGRRIAKQRLDAEGGVAERVDFTWDGTTLTEQTTRARDLPNPVTLTWDHNGLHPVAQTERITAADAPQHEIDRRFFAIVTDLVGTPSELIDETGEIAWRTRRTLWGTTTWASSSTAYTPLRFPGQYFDPETGHHYNCFRHYDPEVGRYLSLDPLGLAPAPNAVSYVHNPHSWVDPLGLAPDGCVEKLYRAPGKGNRASESSGLDPANHPDTIEGGAGTAYLGHTEEVPQRYAIQGTHENGYHEYVMKPGFLDEFPKEKYMRTHDNRPGEFQWLIPREEIPRFNEQIQEVNWVNYYQGYAWRD
ncbi:DUF6531 domain-containing protein [Streptomyces sp. NPDC001922]|uniref:DUF6531 domain-containing protein n=1 Tax=Streptomyces sp. NPDC001922 TaxID=3364624 RepID=UPI0036CE8FE2